MSVFYYIIIISSKNHQNGEQYHQKSREETLCLSQLLFHYPIFILPHFEQVSRSIRFGNPQSAQVHVIKHFHSAEFIKKISDSAIHIKCIPAKLRSFIPTGARSSYTWERNRSKLIGSVIMGNISVYIFIQELLKALTLFISQTIFIATCHMQNLIRQKTNIHIMLKAERNLPQRLASVII